MKLWHDDIRKPPDDSWTWVRTNNDAITLFEYPGSVEEISLDHDLGFHETDPDAPNAVYLRGSSESTGLDLVDWMIANDQVPPKVTVHSWNPAGAERMISTLRANGYFARYVPYETPGTHVFTVEASA